MKNLASKPTDAEMLEIYSLYKQATVGDCNTSKLQLCIKSCSGCVQRTVMSDGVRLLWQIEACSLVCLR